MPHSQAVKACTLLTFSRQENSTPCMDCLQVNIISYHHKTYSSFTDYDTNKPNFPFYVVLKTRLLNANDYFGLVFSWLGTSMKLTNEAT